MLALLEAMAGSGGGWRHGYELMKQTGVRSGTLYPLLMRMSDQGLVEAEWREPAQAGRPPRHVYRLSAAGHRLAETLQAGAAAEAAKASFA